MGMYASYVLPRLMDRALQSSVVAAERAKLVPLASGRVLEVGIGSGLNLPFYRATVEALCGLDPSVDLWRLATARVARTPFDVEFVGASAERLPIADASFDTVVTTFTLCTIPDPPAALAEIGRVLKPGGRLLFVEHGRAPDARIRSWQDRLTPLWRRLAGGCHLNRKIDELIAGAGFSILQMDARYSAFPKLLGYFFAGTATRRLAV
jgi:ubiquinone/menaquinone biosynthesis C-methylase UbiE